MTKHTPVLLGEAIEQLNLKMGGVVVDATLGGGGHTHEILKKIGSNGKLIAIDLDARAVERFKARNQRNKQEIGERIFLANGNFSDLGKILDELKIKKIDAILADLGWSSDQLENPEYGMSFLSDAPLDMRLGKSRELTAEHIVNRYPTKDLEKIIRDFGEEKFWKIIAEKIDERRKEKPIKNTGELAQIIKSAVPPKYRHGRIHPATRTFQAFRIEVNQELSNLEKFIPQAIEALNVSGRLAIISFHSLEDRIVKNSFKKAAAGCVCPKDFPKCTCGKDPQIRIITKHPISPSDKEIRDNPRSRSAKLRVCEKI